MDQKQHLALAALLYQRLDTAVHVKQLGDKLDNWTPKLGHCHENVSEWVRLNPKHHPVRGVAVCPVPHNGGYSPFSVAFNHRDGVQRTDGYYAAIHRIGAFLHSPSRLRQRFPGACPEQRRALGRSQTVRCRYSRFWATRRLRLVGFPRRKRGCCLREHEPRIASNPGDPMPESNPQPAPQFKSS